MPSLILYCKLPGCGKGYASVGEVPSVCPGCGRETKWSTSPQQTDQASTIMWSETDRRFLRALRIDAE